MREKNIASKKMYLQYAKRVDEICYVDMKIQSESPNIKASWKLVEQARKC